MLDDEEEDFDGEGDQGIVDHEDVALEEEEEDEEALLMMQEGGRRGGSNQRSSGHRGRSNSDDRARRQHVPNIPVGPADQPYGREHLDENEEDEEDLEQQLMQHLQKQPEIQKHHNQHRLDEDEEEEEMGDEDLKMYEQFLAANGKHQHNMMIGHQNISGIPHAEDDMSAQEEEDDPVVEQHIDGDDLDMDGDDGHHGHHGRHGEEEDDPGEIDLDNIDYEQLDPQILEIAEQMGVHPREVLKQLMQMNANEGGQGEDMMDEEEDEDPDIYGQEEDEDDPRHRH